MEKYRRIKLNQLKRLFARGYDIRLGAITGFVFGIEGNTGSVMQVSLAERYKTMVTDPTVDEMYLYEHPMVFERLYPYHVNVTKMDIINNLSASYQLFNTEGKLIKTIAYIYMIDFNNKEEAIIVNQLIRLVAELVASPRVEINIVSNKDKMSEALKLIKPLLEIANIGIRIDTFTVNSIPISSLIFSPSANVLAPIEFGLAPSTMVKTILDKLGVGVSAFPEMCSNDALALENGWVTGQLIMFVRADGYIAIRRITNAKMTPAPTDTS